MCFNPCRAGLVAIALLTIAPLHSQTTFASITGIVTDSTGSVVPSAQVVATNVETNIAVQAASNESGNYTIAQLQLGSYTVRVNAPGFKGFVATNVTLASRDIRRVDVSLEVGTVDSSIQVTAEAALIETETARISDTKDAYLMKTLPLNTRSAWAFLALSPNVLQAGGGSSTIRFAGSRGNQSNSAIDGITMADGVDNRTRLESR